MRRRGVWARGGVPAAAAAVALGLTIGGVVGATGAGLRTAAGLTVVTLVGPVLGWRVGARRRGRGPGRWARPVAACRLLGSLVGYAVVGWRLGVRRPDRGPTRHPRSETAWPTRSAGSAPPAVAEAVRGRPPTATAVWRIPEPLAGMGWAAIWSDAGDPAADAADTIADIERTLLTARRHDPPLESRRTAHGQACATPDRNPPRRPDRRRHDPAGGTRVEHPPRTAHRLARRAFLRRAGTTAAGGLALTLAACGGGKKAATPTPTTGPVAPSSTAAPTQSSASPAASPVGAGGQGQAQTRVTLEMVDIAFKPNGFTIPANTDVTITLDNTGAALHNFSVTDHKNPNVKNLGISVDVNPGETKTVTVNAPAGDYYYFCNQPGHEAAGMFGTMHVVQP